MDMSCCGKLLRSCPTLGDTVVYSLPGSSVHGILSQEYCNGLLCPSPRDLPDPGIEPTSLISPVLAGGTDKERQVSATWDVPACVYK